MTTWAAGIRGQHDRRLSQICLAMALLFAALGLALFLFIPEVSVLSEPDGTKYFYIDRQVDLPTGDPAVFSDYSLLPLCGALAACSYFFLVVGAWVRNRQANQPLQAPAAPPGA